MNQFNAIRKKKWLLLLVFLSFGILNQCTSTKVLRGLQDYEPEEVVTTTTIPYPILLLHGLGQKATVWDEAATGYFETSMSLRNGGSITFSQKHNPKSIIHNPNIRPDQKLQTASLKGSGNAQPMDFFTVQFSDPTDSVGSWEAELTAAINLVLQKTKAEKVILIGYSMGGLTARYYLTKHVQDHKVQRLITIGSPHQGSAFAKVWNWKQALNTAMASSPNFITKTLLDQLKGILDPIEKANLPLDAPAIRDLRRPEDGGEFIKRTLNVPHPMDVEYVSIVGNVEVFQGLKELSASAGMEIFRRALGIIGMGPESLFEGGDGVVSTKSQTIKEIPWFKSDANRQKISQTISLSTVHEAHLRQSNEIQRVSLEDQPEFKGAEFVMLGDRKPAIVVEFSDYLPSSRSKINILITGDGQWNRYDVPPEKVQLIRKRDGHVVSQGVFEFPPEVAWQRDLNFQVIVTNSYGNKCTATKLWTWQKFQN